MEYEEIKNKIRKFLYIFLFPFILGTILIIFSFFYKSGLLFYLIFIPLLALLFIFPKIGKYFLVNRKQDFISDMKEQIYGNIGLSSYVLLWNYRFKRYLNAILFSILFLSIFIIPAIIIGLIYVLLIDYGLMIVSTPAATISLIATRIVEGIGLLSFWGLVYGLVYLNISYASSLIGYPVFPVLMRPFFRRLLRISDEYIYNSGLKEAKNLLKITKEKIERKDLDWTKSFKNFLLIFQKTIKKEKNLIIPEVDDVFQMIYGMTRIGFSSHITKITEYIDSLDGEMAKIEENESIEENIVSILSDFSNDMSLKNLKKFKRSQSILETTRKKLTLEFVLTIAISIVGLIIISTPELLNELWQKYLVPNWTSFLPFFLFLTIWFFGLRLFSPGQEEREEILKERSRGKV